MIWLVLWLLLSGALIYFMGWTLYILFRQKNAWKTFAAKKKLRYRSPSVMASPEMYGAVNGFPVSFFIGEHSLQNARSSRKLTAVEVNLSSKMPFEGVLASGGMVPVAQMMRLKEEISPDSPTWDKNYIAAASSRMALQAYLTPERMEALTSLMKVKNGWTILIFRGEMVLLRFDTPDALDTQEKLEKILQKLLSVADILELRKGEEGILKAEAAKSPAKEISIAIDERDFAEAGGIQLEEENPGPEVPDKKNS